MKSNVLVKGKNFHHNTNTGGPVHQSVSGVCGQVRRGVNVDGRITKVMLILTVLCSTFVILNVVEGQAQVTIQVDANYKPCNGVGIVSESGKTGSGSFSIVPNPSAGTFSVISPVCAIPMAFGVVDKPAFRGDSFIRLDIVDPIGKLVYSAPIHRDEQTQSVIPIDLSGMSKGVYLVKVILLVRTEAGGQSGIAYSQKLILE